MICLREAPLFAGMLLAGLALSACGPGPSRTTSSQPAPNDSTPSPAQAVTTPPDAVSFDPDKGLYLPPDVKRALGVKTEPIMRKNLSGSPGNQIPGFPRSRRAAPSGNALSLRLRVCVGATARDHQRSLRGARGRCCLWIRCGINPKRRSLNSTPSPTRIRSKLWLKFLTPGAGSS